MPSEQTGLRGAFAAALRCALGLGGGLVGRDSLGVVSECRWPRSRSSFNSIRASISPLSAGIHSHRGKARCAESSGYRAGGRASEAHQFIGERAVVALHGEMKIGVVILNGIEISARLVTFTCSSSMSSRRTASSGDSPRINLPPGNSQSPACRHSRAARQAARPDPSLRTIPAAT